MNSSNPILEFLSVYHVVIIYGIITIIVGIQIKVFYDNYLKIKLFKSIFPSSRYFRTIKVFVSEEELSSITPEKILSNKDIYTKDRSLKHELKLNEPIPFSNEIN